MKKILVSILITLLVLGAVANTAFAAQPAQASGQCPAPGTGLPGALNMLHDAGMFTIPLSPKGDAGMWTALGRSGC